MTEEKKPVQKQSKKTAVSEKETKKQEAPRLAAKVEKSVQYCRHSLNSKLGKGKIIESLMVNNTKKLRVKFENLKNSIVVNETKVIKE